MRAYVPELDSRNRECRGHLKFKERIFGMCEFLEDDGEERMIK